MFDPAASGNLIIGNYIGVAADGSTAVTGGNTGIASWNGATGNRIGGVNANEGNTIANTGIGVVLDGVVSTSILGNSIYANASLGVDLGWFNGVTPNDLGDGDVGTNDLQNHPVLATARTTGTQLAVTGTLNSSAGGRYRIEFFANDTADGSGHGEGQVYLGYTVVTADGSGNASFSPLLAASVAAGASISATATNVATGDTSEFALNVTATAVNTVTELRCGQRQRHHGGGQRERLGPRDGGAGRWPHRRRRLCIERQ